MSNPNDPNALKFDAREDWLDIPGNQHISFLDDTTFDNFIAEKKRVLVMFYAWVFKNKLLYCNRF